MDDTWQVERYNRDRRLFRPCGRLCPAVDELLTSNKFIPWVEISEKTTGFAQVA